MLPEAGSGAGSRTTGTGNATAHPVDAIHEGWRCWLPVRGPATGAVAVGVAVLLPDWAVLSDRRGSGTVQRGAAPPPRSHTLRRDTSESNQASPCRIGNGLLPLFCVCGPCEESVRQYSSDPPCLEKSLHRVIS